MGDFREGLAGFLGELTPLGRSSRFDLRRRAALRGALDRAAAAALRGSAPAARAKRGRLLRLAGRDAEAAAEFAAALAADPGQPDALAGRWELAASTGKPDERDLDAAIAAAPERGVWRAWRGLWRLSRRLDAESDLTAAIKRGGAAAVLGRLGTALARGRAGDARGAARALDAAVLAAPKEGWLRRLRAKFRFKAGDEPGFVADCEAENLLDEGIGTLAFAFGENAGADPAALTRKLDAAIRRRPGVYWLHALRGDCRRSPEVGDHAGSLADLELAARLAPRPGWVLAHAARARLSGGRAASAAAAAEAAVSAERRCGWIRAWRGELRSKTGDLSGALADFDAAILLDPDYDLAYLWRGAARRAAGRWEEALADLDLALALTPTRGPAWSQRARVYRALGRDAEAERDEARARGGSGGSRETEARRRLDGVARPGFE